MVKLDCNDYRYILTVGPDRIDLPNNVRGLMEDHERECNCMRAKGYHQGCLGTGVSEEMEAEAKKFIEKLNNQVASERWILGETRSFVGGLVTVRNIGSMFQAYIGEEIYGGVASTPLGAIGDACDNHAKALIQAVLKNHKELLSKNYQYEKTEGVYKVLKPVVTIDSIGANKLQIESVDDDNVILISVSTSRVRASIVPLKVLQKAILFRNGQVYGSTSLGHLSHIVKEIDRSCRKSLLQFVFDPIAHGEDFQVFSVKTRDFNRALSSLNE